ncbi:MAG: type I polyketide synthase [Vulcanococcus sp.]
MPEQLSALQLALLAQKASDQRRLLAAEPIALVGMGCRFPAGSGRADLVTPEQFWQFLLEGQDAVSEVPASRWNLDRFDAASRYGAFLAEPELFDPARFGISPREAQAMDPQHRLLLEVAAEALERAALPPEQLRGTAAGVYLGLCTTDYAWRQLRAQAPDAHYDMYFATGTSFSMAPGRLAYALGLQGPALAVDTACSSSLVAVDLAMRSLRDRTTDVALAGGVSLLLTPVNSLCFARSGMMAADGHCKTFDAAADGYVRGEGCGVVVLKRLSDALAQGDPVLAVLRGSGVNQDGASAGLTVPSGEAQAALIRRTLQDAQLSGDDIDVLEAHGTGTPLGDPIELKALAPIYGRPERPEPLRLGSVKTNLGHLEGAAGIAGLIKAALMLQRGQVPPHLHLRQLTPYLSWGDWGLTVPTEAQAWPAKQGPRRAAVSSFGFSGTNAHVLLEQAPELKTGVAQPAPLVMERDLLLLSAGSEAGLQQLAADLADWLAGQPEDAFAAICATSRLARSGRRWRLAIHASGLAEAIEQLQAPEGGLCAPAQPARLAFALTERSTAADWAAWAGFGLQPTALVVPPSQEPLARQLAGEPPQLRLIPEGQASVQLEEHGYGPALPLVEPSADALAALWLQGHSVDWSPLAPQGRWQRQVLPVTPFDRIRCWLEEDTTAESLGGLQHQRQWQPAELPDSSTVVAAPLWQLGGQQPADGDLRWLPDLAAFEAALEESKESKERPDLLLAPLTFAGGLDLADWQGGLPVLGHVLGRLSRLNRVHWWMPQQATPEAEAWAALARCMARELGPQAGGLLWGEPLAPLLPRLGSIAAGEEWRLGSGGQLERSVLVALGVPTAGRANTLLPPSSTTVITGGLGALGLQVAEALQRWGARHLTLVARREPSAEQQQRIAALEQAGASVELEQLDLSDGLQVAALFERLKASGRPLAGIIHAAGLLDDGLLSNQTPERCAAVSAAKAQGALHLDRCSRALPHNFFVCFSSLAAALGSPGQGAYGAANGFLDGLMLQRNREGLPGLSINWGPWAGGGMAARHQGGLKALQPAEALALLARWLPQQGRVVLADLRQAASANPLVPRLQALGQALEAAEPDQAQALVEECLAGVLSELGGFEVSELGAETRLDALGLDSLMAVELATAVQAGLGVSLGLGALAGDPTLGSLSAHLLGLLQNPGAELEQVDLGVEAQLPADFSVQSAVKAGPGEAILLTGGSGFLGAFLLADQLTRHPGLTVYCLVRAESAASGRARLRSNLEHYDLWQEDWASRIVALPGDLAQPRLGLESTTWEGLVERISGVLHNGAQLSYVAPYGQLKASNVSGTLEVLRLAAAAGAPVEYISSTSVYEAAAYRGQELDERSDLAEWRGIHLGYSQSKWVSERLVWQAAAEGLPVRIYRPPLIAGHSQTGAWHEQDFLHRLVRGCLALQQAPLLPMELDLVPVDYVVNAVGALAWSPVDGCDVLHLHHPRPVLWQTFLEGLIAQGAPLDSVPLDQWLAALAEQPSNPLYPLQPFFTHRWGVEQLTYPELNAPGLRAKPSCTASRERLSAFGIACPDFEQLVAPYARTFLLHG